jgi:CheY-like chemotaxis protein
MLSGVSVLVIDDDLPIRTLITTLLERSHADVDCVGDGDDAITRLGDHDYSVIVLDLMLPTVDGFAVIDQLASTNPALLSRVIVLTAAAQAKLAPLAKRNVCRVMRKPFDIGDFTNAVLECATAVKAPRPEVTPWPARPGPSTLRIRR